jgi:hypothetical protein
VNVSRSCNQDFGSQTAFNAHRVGPHDDLIGRDRSDARRCLSVEELRGCTVDGRGRWRRPSNGAPRAPFKDQVTPETDGRSLHGVRRAPRCKGSTRLPELRDAKTRTRGARP